MLSQRMLHTVCYLVSAVALVGAGAYVIFGEQKALGILAVLIAAVLSRVLILNIVHQKD